MASPGAGAATHGRGTKKGVNTPSNLGAATPGRGPKERVNTPPPRTHPGQVLGHARFIFASGNTQRISNGVNTLITGFWVALFRKVRVTFTPGQHAKFSETTEVLALRSSR